MAKRTPKKPKSSQPQDAVQLLKADHKQVRKLFEQFHGASDDEKGSIASSAVHRVGYSFESGRGTVLPGRAVQARIAGI